MKEYFKRVVTQILSKESAILLKRKKPKIIAVTGNVGKTSAKDAIYAVISTKYHARKSDKSFNSEIGVPLTILGLPNAWANPIGWLWNIIVGFKIAFFSNEYPEIIVVEVGADHPGDIKNIGTWLTPDVTVITHIPEIPVHVEFFPDAASLAAEKIELAKALKSGGTLIVDADSIFSMSAKDVMAENQKLITYGKKSGADIQLLGSKPMYAESSSGKQKTKFPIGEEARFVAGGGMGTEYTLTLPGTIGTHRSFSGLAAIAVAQTFDISLVDAIKALATTTPSRGRMRLIDGIKDSVIIDDTYNSSPIAVQEALQALKSVHAEGKKIVVLGDMMELGAHSPGAHYAVGEKVARAAHVLVTVGIRAREIARGALEHGMAETHIFQYEDSKKAGKFVETIIEAGDVVLIKGSQSMRMERAVLEVMDQPEQASELLVRQDSVWKSKE
ncbi:MAG TPA: UDP-N-acetylmuramoyl-tripeptide--D-alanyl-D-alanine ligase [Candidatus Paceibacterota bacterium]|nr:UDP-N-acetylmuramoyl-tripeptide--D-alanyl-D-alanine ligase [Candidatus Paceibacterota bacterium]